MKTYDEIMDYVDKKGVSAAAKEVEVISGLRSCGMGIRRICIRRGISGMVAGMLWRT